MTLNVARHDVLLRERQLLAELDCLKKQIIDWAKQNDLWFDAGFKSPFEHRNEPPRQGEVLYLCADGPLTHVFCPDHEEWERLHEELRTMLEVSGWIFELEEHGTLNLTPEDEAKQLDFLHLQRWQWIQKLSERRLFDLHAEIFEHFASDHDSLQKLHWRELEQLIDAVFRNQGFRTELGPGGDDGGVDLRLYQSESISEIVTLVQIKRYKAPIKLEPVAALAGVAQMECAPRALFVTSSRFQPKARKFALNTHDRLDMPQLELADGSRVGEWCRAISKQLNDYFQSGDTPVPPILSGQPATPLTGKIVCASWGYNMTINAFAVIEADFPHEVILRTIGSKVVAHDGYGQRGTEEPDLSTPPGSYVSYRFLAFKHDTGVSMSFWGDRKLYSIWDGTPQHFDYCD